MHISVFRTFLERTDKKKWQRKKNLFGIIYTVQVMNQCRDEYCDQCLHNEETYVAIA